MSSLSHTEKVKLEKLLGMSSGYVWNFSDKTFHAFIADVVGLDIHDKKYQGVLVHLGTNGLYRSRRVSDHYRQSRGTV
jgi:hypothetical protein